MDQSLVERRVDARFPPPPSHSIRATLRPGCIVTIINLSAGGVLLEADRPLRPGARVHLQLVTEVRTLVVPAHVLRCAVWTLKELAGPRYRGALRFEQRCEPFEQAPRVADRLETLSRP